MTPKQAMGILTARAGASRSADVDEPLGNALAVMWRLALEHTDPEHDHRPVRDRIAAAAERAAEALAADHARRHEPRRSVA